jgi:hypothetical protein
MISEASFIDVALRSWKNNVDRAGTFSAIYLRRSFKEKLPLGRTD